MAHLDTEEEVQNIKLTEYETNIIQNNKLVRELFKNTSCGQ
jgi:hypothetical protein